MNPARMLFQSLKSGAVAILGFFVVISSLLIALPTSAYADAAAQEGVNITPSSPTSFGTADFYQSLKNLKADHANAVNFVIRLDQSTVSSTDIGPTNNTPTDASLVTAIQEAHSLGLMVTLKPHVDPNDGNWRAFIDPTNRAEWFQNYDVYLKHYAQIAQANGVEQYVIGTELIDMTSATHNSSNTAYWDGLISDVRSMYSGQLGYAANWGPTGSVLDEKNQIGFWDKLDFAGLDAYYPLSTATDDSVPSLEAAWAVNGPDVQAFAAKVNKPLIITEIGYQSTKDSYLAPGNYQTSNGVDDSGQANAYQAFFSYWSSSNLLKGIYLWEWQPESNAGGSSDQDYTPQNKPAEAVMSAWFGGTGVATPYIAAASLATTHSFTATATVSNASLVIGSPENITSTVVNNGNGAENATIIDTEVYDSTGAQVFQNFTPNENYTKGQSKSYQTSWTPTVAGTYTVKVGVFTSDWSQNYVWNATASSFIISSPMSVTGQVAGTSATATAATTTPNTSTPITATVTNNGTAISNAIIDVEVYDASGNRVSQNFTQNQSFSVNDSKQYSFASTPSAAGTYRIAVGVFSNDWSHNYVWVANAGILSVVTPTPIVTAPVSTSMTSVASSTSVNVPAAITTPVVTPSATTTPVLSDVTSAPIVPAVIDIWWPTTGSTVSGVTPFKALVENQSVSNYTMTWQVDGGQSNSMYESNDGYAHMESMADVSGWNWNGSGPYLLTFTAKDPEGNIVATKTVSVTIST
jgi:hypothetical protein